jgi:hypothetical protein
MNNYHPDQERQDPAPAFLVQNHGLVFDTSGKSSLSIEQHRKTLTRGEKAKWTEPEIRSSSTPP